MYASRIASSVFLSAGFRPFFLFAGLAAVVIMLRTWLIFSGASMSPAGGPVLWHGHELLFGMLGATMVGFLLTAVPNWTATEPVHGWPLLLLVVLWIAGRVVMWNGDPSLWARAVEWAFLPAAALFAFRPLVGRRLFRAWLPAGVVVVLALANLAWHIAGAVAAPLLVNQVVAFAAMLVGLLIAIIGGRITPAFTRNRMRAQGAGPLPRPGDLRDTAAIVASALVAVAELVSPSLAAAAAALAAILHALRLHGWRGPWTWRNPLLFALHLGYGWLVAGYAVRALPLLGIDGGGAWALHGILAGAAGTMVLAVMSRATLGHTGRALIAGLWLTAALVLVQAAAVARLIAPWAGLEAWLLAPLFWSLAFAIFLLRCGPMLLAARLESETTAPVPPRPR